jgi:hypothetical protein
MKYLITESQIDKVIFKYLDNQDFLIHDQNKKFNSHIYFLNSESDKIAQISVYVNNDFGEIRNWVFVNSDLINELTNFFSIDKTDCLNVVSSWVSNTLNIKVREVSSGFLYPERLNVKNK